MTTTVKICGLQSVEMLESMINLPVDQVGFVFAKSKRQVSVEQAKAMVDFVRSQERFNPLTVGVFVNPEREFISSLLEMVPLDVVQVHGSEPPEFCRWVKDTFGVQIYKSYSIAAAQSNSEPLERNQAGNKNDHESVKHVAAQLDPFKGTIDALLLDTFDPVYGGGSGKVFAWERIAPFQAWAREAGIQLIVAGGLTPDNVGDLIARTAPDGVDVSSGVETDGVKDMMKITAFVERVKQR